MPARPFLRVALTIAALTVVAAVACFGPGPRELSPTFMTYEMREADSVGPVCVHLERPYSERLCPDSMLIAPLTHFRPSEVTAETLVVRTSDGRNIRIALPNRTDAIFLTRSAMSTFLVRHYDATNPAKAAETRLFIRNSYRQP